MLPPDAQGEEALGPALVGEHVNAVALDKIRHLVAGKTNEHGASALQAAKLGRLPKGFFPIFLHTIYAGLVLPTRPSWRRFWSSTRSTSSICTPTPS